MSTPKRSAYVANALPLYSHVMQKIGLADFLTRMIDKKDSQADVDAGTIICGMILNLLSDAEIYLMHLPRFFSDKPMGILFPWRRGIEPEDFDQYRAGDVLDQFYEASPQHIYSELGRKLISVYDLCSDVISFDTTSKSFKGVFEGDDISPLNITFGFSKDHRKDLKQIIFGLGVSLEGIPVLAEITDGNASDKTINGTWITNVKTWLGKKKDDFLLYIADSAAITSPNLRLFKKERIDFISRLPHTFGLADTLLDRAIGEEESAWTEIGAISDKKNAATYRSISYHEELEDEDHRFAVCHSSMKDKRKLKSLDRALKKEQKELSKEAETFSKQDFFCEKDAVEQSEKFVKKMHKATNFHTLTYAVEKVEREKKRDKRGRPPKGWVPEKETRYIVKLTVKPDKTALERAEKKCGMFVLVSSLGEEKKDDEEVLRMYKGQATVEGIFRLLKDPTLVASYNLKSPTRIVAFGFVVLLAVLVYTLTEYAVRKALEDGDVEPILDLRGKETRRPTAKTIAGLMSSILVVRRGGPEGEWLEPDIPLNENQRRVLAHLGFDESIYTTVL